MKEHRAKQTSKTDSQTERHTDRQIDRQTDSQTNLYLELARHPKRGHANKLKLVLGDRQRGTAEIAIDDIEC
jgi:hypothetical protein